MRASRRALLLAVAAFPAGALRAAQPQPLPASGRRWRVGWLTPASNDGGPPAILEAFVAGMREKGWVRDTHYEVDVRVTNDARRYGALAQELVARPPDVLMAIETTARLLRQHTESIPIVMLISIDPVAAGLVQSLARPGTNVTGMSGHFDAIVVKWVEALIEIVPRARRMAFLGDPGWSDSLRVGQVMESAARAKGAEFEMVPITTDVQSVHKAFDDFERRRPDGLLIPIQGGALTHAALIRSHVRRLRLPAVGLHSAGAVLQISPDFAASAREAAEFVDRILRGASPADLPVRQARAFVTSIHPGLARELGIELPATVRARADKVIE